MGALRPKMVEGDEAEAFFLSHQQSYIAAMVALVKHYHRAPSPK
jgi:hypothetical protein